MYEQNNVEICSILNICVAESKLFMNDGVILIHFVVMESWDASRDPFLQVSVSKVSGLISVSKTTGLETLNVAKKWYSKISIIRQIFVCCICR